jgi:hypothetical protein
MHVKVKFVPARITLCLILLALFFHGETYAAEQDAMSAKLSLPSEAEGWKWDGKEERYDDKAIFNYIDGAGELYLAYGFQSLIVRRLEKQGKPLITADVYEMGSSADAYGVFSFERQDAEAGIGQGSEFGGGLLRFWKGNYFVSVYAEGEGDDVDRAVKALGRAVAASISKTGPKPQLIEYLPGKSFGLDEKNIYFFRSHVLLNQRFFIAHQNILQLGPTVETVLAEYRPGREKMRLLLIRYPSETKALDALSSFRKAYLPEVTGRTLVKTEDGAWIELLQFGPFVAIVFGAGSESDATNLLKAVEINLKGRVK